MALNRYACQLLARHIPGASILSLGHPDLLLTSEDCHSIFGRYPVTHVDTGARHGVKHPLPEAHGLFDLLEARMTCVDVVKSRGCELLTDLNQAGMLADAGYDVVIDAGTTEHCFNVGQAIMNAAGAVNVGGRILHTPPMTMLNHGFWNFSPTVLQDFYEQNGWTVELLQARDTQGRGRVVSVEPVKRFLAPSECALYCMAQRMTDAPLRMPTQTKYLKGVP